MNNSEMKVVRFDEHDVIATSAGVLKTIKIENSLNGIQNDNRYTLGDGRVFIGNGLNKDIVNSYFGDRAYTKLLNGSNTNALSMLVKRDTGVDGLTDVLGSTGEPSNYYNKTFYWVDNKWSTTNPQ